jgi:hypothetical protein
VLEAANQVLEITGNIFGWFAHFPGKLRDSDELVQQQLYEVFAEHELVSVGVTAVSREGGSPVVNSGE